MEIPVSITIVNKDYLFNARNLVGLFVFCFSTAKINVLHVKSQ